MIISSQAVSRSLPLPPARSRHAGLVLLACVTCLAILPEGSLALAQPRERHRTIPPRCPVGSVLVDGRCITPRASPLCPPGTVGHYPVCRPAVRSACPPGTVGIYPNCRP